MTDQATRDLEYAQQALDEITTVWDDLEASLEPGTIRRWTERPDDAETAARRAKLDAVERAERDEEAPGYSKAPLNVGVLDTLIAERFALVELEQEIRERLGFNQLTGRDAIEAARWIASALPGIDDPDLLEHTRRETTRVARTLRSALGDAEPVHPLKAACPICDSLSLRAFPEREVIACINPRCECADEDCLCHTGRRHRWRRDDWSWLAQVLGVELAS